MATRKWFVITDGAELGPLGPVGLRRLVRRGEIGVDTPIRREDQREPVAAARVLGLFPAAETAPATPRHHGPHPKVYGPYTGLRPLGIATAATLFGFALLGVCGIVVAVRQLRFVADFADSYALVSEGEAPLFGAGVFAVLALVATGGLFVWWIWIARVNLPHLIHARIRYAPSWAAIAWFVPVLNLGLTHAVVLGAETDVCVMQTVLGLRRMGLTVILHSDAVFSSESNVGPGCAPSAIPTGINVSKLLWTSFTGSLTIVLLDIDIVSFDSVEVI